MKIRKKLFVITMTAALLFALVPVSAFAVTSYKPTISFMDFYQEGQTVYASSKISIFLQANNMPEADLDECKIKVTNGSTSLYITATEYDCVSRIMTFDYIIPTTMSSGKWWVDEVRLLDYYGHYAIYSYTEIYDFVKDYIFTIAGNPIDTNGPVIKNVTVNKPEGDLTVGDTFSVLVTVEDENMISEKDAGVSLYSSSNFLSTEKASYDEKSNVLTMTYKIKESTRSGNYKIEYLVLNDVFGNMAYMGENDSNCMFNDYSFNIVGTKTDSADPVLNGVIFNDAGKDFSAGDQFTFYVKATDNNGLKDTVAIASFRCDEFYFNIESSYYDEKNQYYVFNYSLASGLFKGKWSLFHLIITDKYGNSILKYNDTYGDYSFNCTTPVKKPAQITFDPDGGTCSISNILTNCEGWVPALPVPVMENYDFIGWYIKSGDRHVEKAEDYTVYDKDTTLYASWIPKATDYYVKSGMTLDVSIEVKGKNLQNGSWSVEDGSMLEIKDVSHSRKTVDDYVYLTEGVKIYGKKVGITRITYQYADSDYSRTFSVWIEENNCTHVYDEGVITKVPTCKEKGVRTYTCSICNAIKEEEIAEASDLHVWDEGTVSNGIKTFTCTLCGAQKTELVETEPIAFSDVSEEAYYYNPVVWAVTNKITNGYTPTTFAPDKTCTRAQIVALLWRASGCPEPTIKYSGFSDLDKSSYYYDAVLWAVENGITSGTSATTFSPYSVVTREQFVTFLWKNAGKPQVSAINPFSDIKRGDYFYDAVLWASKLGITTGINSTTFGTGAGCTRGQTVTFLYRYYN